jgi:hypothetical protein
MRVNDLFTEALPDEVARLAARNRIANPNLILVGQKISLPNGTTYTVAPGDTLSAIAQGQFKGTPPQNTVRVGPNPNIKPDTRSRAAASVPAASPAPAATSPTVQTPVSGSEQPITSVVRGGSGYTDVTTADGQTQRRIGVRNWRNNNPGNLEFGPYAKSKGAIGTDGRFAVFATLEDGLKAKRDLVFGPRYINLSIADAINKYAPPSENATNAYIQSVVKATGVNPETPLKSLNSSQQNAFLDAINRVEGFKPGRIQQLDTTLTADIHEESNPEDTVELDIPLLLRIMEYSKEDAQTDMDLHNVVDKLISLSQNGQTLDMKNYDEIVGSVHEGDSSAEKLIKDIEYDADADLNTQGYKLNRHVISNSSGMPTMRYTIHRMDGQQVGPAFDSRETAGHYLKKLDQGNVVEGHGRYWCSTDKRWKERQGPKQSRG